MTDAIKLAQQTAFEQHIDDCIVSEAGLSQALKRDGFGDYTTPWVQSKYVAFLAALRAQPDHSEQHLEMVAAARAVVERWDTPLWKDVPATAVYINRLRDALPAIEGKL